MLRTRVFTEYIDNGRMTMVELGRVTGYAPEHLSRIRNGHTPISDAFAGRVCRLLSRPLHELFYEDADPEAGTVSAARRA